MTPQSAQDAGSSSWFQRAAAYGVAAPRPGLLLVVLMLIAACIVALTALDLANLSAQLASVSGVPEAAKLPSGAMRANLLNSSLFIAAFMGGVLALIAFGHNWARWVWLVVCMLFGSLLALGTLVLMFAYAPQAAALKGVVYLVLFVLSCMLFAPSCNAWFRQIKSIRNDPRRSPGEHGAAPSAPSAPSDNASQPYHPYAPPGTVAPPSGAQVALAPRPRTISLAIVLCLLNSLGGSVLGLIYMSDMLATQNVTVGEGFMKYVVYGSIVAAVILVLVLMYFIARGSNVARWIWTAMAVIGLLNAYTALKTAFVVSPVYGTLATISQLIALAATILLFVPASSRWMRAAAQARRARQA